ncbi:MAG: rhomboid family intramembrane serine protease [Gemmatimonadetes bacterium]|nr:rhomboid family intramembrane serine protease [Gemmatimonadota bacterium]NNK62740.1 rhomboid family intramembrane serine protease [Gemmatimonadota bacterium]
MFPLHDDNPTLRRPWVTYGLVAACLVVWGMVQGAGLDVERMGSSVCSLGAIPLEVRGQPGVEAGPCRPGGWAAGALVTSMFLHGGWFHLIGNLWFLWIFGNNVEDSMGRFRFVVFYLLVGVIAALAHVAAEPDSALPMVGASGAISGVMGAYLVLFPRARVKTLLVLIVFFTVIELPAFVYLLYWLALQLFSSAAGASSGVAFWAHIGGFLAGALLVPLFRRRRPPDGWVRAPVGV